MKLPPLSKKQWQAILAAVVIAGIAIGGPALAPVFQAIGAAGSAIIDATPSSTMEPGPADYPMPLQEDGPEVQGGQDSGDLAA